MKQMKNSGLVRLLVLILCTVCSQATIKAGNQMDAGTKTVKLLSRQKYQNYSRACFSFEYGINGEDALRVTRNDWDIQFGNGGDVFDVTMVTDDRSRIKDLGELSWDDGFKAPLLTAHDDPKTREPSVAAVIGHIYLVHTKDKETDLYALFRVESLEPGDNVTISWKLIPAPEIE
jgi:hypothetical protein